MQALHDTETRPERTFLIGVQTDDIDKVEASSLLRELRGLVESLGLEPVGELFSNLRSRSPALLVGSGKAQEIVDAAKAVDAQSIIFDAPLAPMQQRNWEELSGLAVYDRNEVIIRIFGNRALSKEAALQVELARLKFSLPRLAHMGQDLMQQKGGRYGTKGSGEKKIELDRRRIEQRIDEIKEELEQVRVSRGVQRKRRERLAVPGAAIVGYTNAGKSSLLNAMTKANVLAEDKLFATLDPTTRRISLTSGGNLLVTDTVGFVRNLPHGLVEAFKATLEEAARADLLVHVVDASDPEADRHMATTAKVLAEIGAGEVPVILVFNKMDLVADPVQREALLEKHPGSIGISTLRGEGVRELMAAIEDRLTADSAEWTLLIPYAEHAQVALLHREAAVLEESDAEGGTRLVCRLPERLESRFERFKVED